MSLPPGPRLPPVVQIGRWILSPLKMLEECRARYGDVFSFKGFQGRHFVIVGDPALIKQIFTGDPDTLLAGAGNAVLLEPILGKHSLLTLDRGEHLRQRRLLLPAFHGERMQTYATIMRDITESAIGRWPLHRPFSLAQSMQDITLDVILRTVFGLERPDQHGKLRADLVAMLDIAANPLLLFPGMLGIDPFAIPWLRLTKLKRGIDDQLFAIIADRRKSPAGGTDVLAMMLAARDEQGEAMTDIELRDELVTLLLAGHETTATSLAWALDQLLANPATLERLRADLDAGREDYLDCVIRETLRVRPIIPLVGRQLARPYQLGEWLLPAGTQLAPSIYLAGHRADAYPAPDEFRPERWLGVKPDPYTWLPFGGGVRRCIGMAFAQFEMRIVLAGVVQRARLSLVDGPAKVVRRGITLAPSKGRMVVAIERAAQRTAAA